MLDLVSLAQRIGARQVGLLAVAARLQESLRRDGRRQLPDQGRLHAPRNGFAPLHGRLRDLPGRDVADFAVADLIGQFPGRKPLVGLAAASREKARQTKNQDP
jgi:hypothetical protein